MATKIYVTNPEFAIGTDIDHIQLGYAFLEWADGLPAVLHPPFNEDSLVELDRGDTAGIAKSKIIANLVAHVAGVSSNDIYFIPEIGTGA